MINNTETNSIKLTDEQAVQLEQYELKLSNLLSEITNATKILKGTKMESDRAVKERAYYEELLTELTPKVEEKKKQFDNFNEEINKATSELAKLQEEIRIKSEKQSTIDNEFNSRELKIIKEQEILDQKTKKIDSSNQLLDSHLNTFNEKVAKLKEIISTF